MRGLRLILVVATIAVVGLVVGADPASAAIPTNSSALGAGYRSAPPGGVTLATVAFTVPDVSCASDSDFEPLFLGVFALDGSGDQTMTAFAQASCNLGSKVYFAQVSNGETDKFLGIVIGDTIVAKITETGSTSTAFLKNVTTKTTISVSKAAANDPSVLIGDSGWATVPTFTKVHMFKAMVNGVALGDAPATTRERLKFNSTVQIAPSLVPAGKSGFNLVFKAHS